MRGEDDADPEGLAYGLGEALNVDAAAMYDEDFSLPGVGLRARSFSSRNA